MNIIVVVAAVLVGWMDGLVYFFFFFWFFRITSIDEMKKNICTFLFANHSIFVLILWTSVWSLLIYMWHQLAIRPARKKKLMQMNLL